MLKMFDSFVIVGTQVLTLFILIGIGFVCGKLKLLQQAGVKSVNDIVIYIVNPCLIISAFQRDFEAGLLHNFLLALMGAALAHVICLIIASLVFRRQDEGRRKVLRFASIFSNCGFMGIPLLSALL